MCSVTGPRQTTWVQGTDLPAVVAMQKWGVNEFSEQPDRTNAVTGQYAAACRQVAADEGVPVLDLWTGGCMAKRSAALCSDATHVRLPQCHAKHRPACVVIKLSTLVLCCSIPEELGMAALPFRWAAPHATR